LTCCGNLKTLHKVKKRITILARIASMEMITGQRLLKWWRTDKKIKLVVTSPATDRKNNMV